MRILAFCWLALFTVPVSAAAEWHLVPMVGITTLGSTSIFDPEEGSGRTHGNLGGAVSWLSSGLFGVEALATWTPSFFAGEPGALDVKPVEVNSSRALSLMGNFVVTLPQRWTEYGLRPFVSAGLGLMHARHDDIVFPVEVNVRGFNVGGGAVGFLTRRVGLRFDVRYHSTLNPSEDTPSFGSGHLRYVTGSIGLVFRR